VGSAIRRGVLTGAVFVAAAVGGVLGNQITNRWDGAAAAFVIVTVVGGGLAVWLDRMSVPPGGQVVPSAPAVGPSMVAQGVQVGHGNQQVNLFGPTVHHPQAGWDINVGETINVDNRRARTDDPTP
jgi:hypothetical protein